jgi:hypothetical protein
VCRRGLVSIAWDAGTEMDALAIAIAAVIFALLGLLIAAFDRL